MECSNFQDRDDDNCTALTSSPERVNVNTDIKADVYHFTDSNLQSDNSSAVNVNIVSDISSSDDDPIVRKRSYASKRAFSREIPASKNIATSTKRKVNNAEAKETNTQKCTTD